MFGSPDRSSARHARAHRVAPARFDLDEAYRNHGPDILGFAINTLRDRQLAEDCVQECFLRAWRSRDSFDPARGSERTWLFAIARNVIVDAARSRTRAPRPDGDDLEERMPPIDNDPLDRLGLVEGLMTLSEEHREVLVAIHVRGLSYAELSATTGVPVGTLRTRAYYALRALRTHLEREESHDDLR